MQAQPTTLVVFDYDWSLIDTNSDTWILEKLSKSAIDHVKANQGKTQWTKLMDEAIKIAQQEGHSVEIIEQQVAQVPVEESMLQAIRHAYEAGAELRILSDANNVYIESFLKFHDLLHMFSEIATNRASINEQGEFSIDAYHPQDAEAHGCQWCPVNLCKGSVLESSINNNFDRIIYVGDGSGDFCPAIRLRSEDVLLIRNVDERPKAKGLLKRLKKYPNEVTAQQRYFKGGDDFLQHFQELL